MKTVRHVKVGQYLYWLCSGSVRRQEEGCLLAECQVKGIKGTKVNIEGPSMLGFGMWHKTVPMQQLVR